MAPDTILDAVVGVVPMPQLDLKRASA